MPIIKSAKKALRQTKKRTAANKAMKRVLKAEIKKVSGSGDQKSVSLIYSTIDKLAKKHVFHKNKSARIKSKIAKRLSAKTA
ncbi:MAG: 30S ribosomal protein S20 [Patescibacteria group bacterium]|jgi:small subunit ribosomal protein S20